MWLQTQDLMVVAECGCNSSVVIIKLVPARTGKSVVIEPITQRVSDSLISRGHRLLIQPWSPRPARPLKIRDECCAGRVLGFFLICSTFTPHSGSSTSLSAHSGILKCTIAVFHIFCLGDLDHSNVFKRFQDEHMFHVFTF